MSGDVVLIQRLPGIASVGIDSLCLTGRFAGVARVPPGAHFFWVSETDGASARSGFWILSRAGDARVHTLRWDEDGGLFPSEAGQEGLNYAGEELLSYADVDAQLAVWPRLVGNVTGDVVGRVIGEKGVHTGDGVRRKQQQHHHRHQEDQGEEGGALTFTFDQGDRTYSLEDLGSSRSLAARDPTAYILSAAGDADGRGLVGELELAYVTGMHLGNEACIQQWWHVVLRLFLRAHGLMEQRPGLAACFLRSLAAQLAYGEDRLEGSVLDHARGGGRDLRLALIVYKARLEEALEDAGKQGAADTARGEVLAVSTAFARLEATVAEVFGWDLKGDYVRRGKVVLEDGEEVELEVDDLEEEDERGEWAPEVVEVDEDGRERGLISWD